VECKKTNKQKQYPVPLQTYIGIELQQQQQHVAYNLSVIALKQLGECHTTEIRPLRAQIYNGWGATHTKEHSQVKRQRAESAG